MSASEVRVPDIGDFKNVPVIEVHVKPGQSVKAEDPLVTLESDKAAMDVPAPQDGVIESVTVTVGDKVSEGTLIAKIAGAGSGAGPVKHGQGKPASGLPPAPSAAPPGAASAAPAPVSTIEPMPEPLPIPREVPAPPLQDFAGVHASPAVRRLARELDVDLTALKGTGEHGRITRDDVKRALAKESGAPAGGAGIPEIPPIDRPHEPQRHVRDPEAPCPPQGRGLRQGEGPTRAARSALDRRDPAGRRRRHHRALPFRKTGRPAALRGERARHDYEHPGDSRGPNGPAVLRA